MRLGGMEVTAEYLALLHGIRDTPTLKRIAQLVGDEHLNADDGEYFIINVPPGTYTVIVEAVEPPPAPAECKELKPIDALILEYDALQAGDRAIDQVSWYRDKFDADDPTKNLINSTGRVLWKQPVDGPIMGEVYQVDFYKNGKLQYLFNTAGKIHLIDRNGNYVERYPISLRANATNPLALFDYDKSRDYRLFIATEDRRIYLYDIEGNMISGWKFRKTEWRLPGIFH